VPDCLQSVINISGMAITGRLVKEAPGFPYRHPDQIMGNIRKSGDQVPKKEKIANRGGARETCV